MATLKIDDRERYPGCLWISVAGSLAGAFSFGWNVAVLNTALPYIAKDLHYHKDAVLSSAVVLGAGEQASTCEGHSSSTGSSRDTIPMPHCINTVTALSS
jgi:hypothetical protein